MSTGGVQGMHFHNQIIPSKAFLTNRNVEKFAKRPGLVLEWCWTRPGLVLDWCWTGAGLVLDWGWTGAGLVLDWCWTGAGLGLDLGCIALLGLLGSYINFASSFVCV